MNKYLFLDFNDRLEKILIVESSSKREALYKIAMKLIKEDLVFKEYVLDRSINMSFAEMFCLQTKEEISLFNDTGEYIFDPHEFKKRVKKYFKFNPIFSEEYINYYFSDDSSLSDEILIEIWLRDWNSATLICLNDIERIK